MSYIKIVGFNNAKTFNYCLSGKIVEEEHSNFKIWDDLGMNENENYYIALDDRVNKNILDDIFNETNISYELVNELPEGLHNNFNEIIE